MRSIILLSILCLAASASTNAEYLEANLEQMSPLQYNSWGSIPEKLIALFKKAKLDKSYELVYDEVNPFYLCGDFDGDDVRDYAVLLKSKDGKLKPVSEIAILRGNGIINWLKEELKHLRGDYPGPSWVCFL